MSKCEWKDGEFYPCEIHDEMRRHGGSFMYFNTGRTSYTASFCPACGADIRKPESKKPLIVKSGGTYVAYWQSVDYLLVRPWEYSNEEHIRSTFKLNLLGNPDDWKSFTGPNPDITELTDEIAKTRPMVISDPTPNRSRLFCKLVWVDVDNINLITSEGWNGNNHFRLATPKELNHE